MKSMVNDPNFDGDKYYISASQIKTSIRQLGLLLY